MTACHVTTYYYVGFCYIMLRRYPDAIRTFVSILNFILRMRQYHTRSYQYDQVSATSRCLWKSHPVHTSVPDQQNRGPDVRVVRHLQRSLAEQVRRQHFQHRKGTLRRAIRQDGQGVSVLCDRARRVFGPLFDTNPPPTARKASPPSKSSSSTPAPNSSTRTRLHTRTRSCSPP